MKNIKRTFFQMEEDVGKGQVDLQRFLSKILPECDISYIQMDGMKNIGNYLAFMDAVEKKPTLMILREGTINRRKISAPAEEQGREDALAWIEKNEKGMYMIHRGHHARACSRWSIFRIYLAEKRNLRGKYLVCAALRDGMATMKKGGEKKK
ncbi:MAG: hypothetical protein ACOYJU_01330 [Anaerovoracaceae bacterium]|jgi:hypothetical protein